MLAARKFVRRSKLFVGKSEEESEDGKMCDLINEMLVDYENNHHILYSVCDNYFTSIPLLRRLLSKKIFICGSVNLNRLKIDSTSPLTVNLNKSYYKRFEHRHYQCDDVQLVVDLER